MSLEVVSTIFWCHCLCVTVSAAVLLLLLLSYYCCFHITPVTSAFPGAAELTTQLLRLISILYLPLCRINKLGNTSLEDCCDPLYLWVIKGPCYTQVHSPARFASSIRFVRNYSPRQHTRPPRWRWRHNFASSSTNTPKISQGSDKRRM